jgi:GTPase SAR1 family protein
MEKSRRKGSDTHNTSLKACLFASEQVNKHELIEKYMAQDRLSSKINMMGYIVKTVSYKSQNIKFNIWDVATQERYLVSSGLILRDCDIIMCLFDYANPDSLTFLKEKYTFLKTNSKTDVVFGLIGLNYGLDLRFSDLHNETMTYASKLKAYFVANNFKLEMNVNEAFEKGIDLALAMRDIEEQKQQDNGFRIRQDETIEANDIADVKRSLETNLNDLTNGIIGKVFGGDKEKIRLCSKNLNIVKKCKNPFN